MYADLKKMYKIDQDWVHLTELDKDHGLLTFEFAEWLMDEVGLDGSWHKIIFDDYDASFELKRCPDDFNITDEQIKKILTTTGFQRFWVCYETAELYCSLDSLGKIRRTRTNRPANLETNKA